MRAYANWRARGERTMEVPFVVAHILRQDFAGVPLLGRWSDARPAEEKGRRRGVFLMWGSAGAQALC